MLILIVGFLINLIIVRFIKYKYVFLIGYYSFFMVCFLLVVFGIIGMKGIELILFGGFLFGVWSLIFFVIG